MPCRSVAYDAHALTLSTNVLKEEDDLGLVIAGCTECNINTCDTFLCHVPPTSHSSLIKSESTSQASG